MDSVQQAAQVLGEHRDCIIYCACGMTPDAYDFDHAGHVAANLAIVGLLADTRCRKCNGTGGTDLGGAHCAVCDGTGHRRGER